jgi:hypothetical protein
LLIATVQLGAAGNFLSMMTGGTGGESGGTSDMLAGVLQLLKDQVDGPLSVGLYADSAGKPSSLVMAARLKEAGLTRELLNGVTMLGGEDKNKPNSITYRGQNLVTLDLPQSKPASALPLPLQPTFTITTSNFLLIGTTLASVKQSLDAGAQATGGLAARSDVAAMMRDFPPTANTDVWLLIPKPTGKLSLGGKSPLPIPVAGLPLGSTVMSLRFTPAGVRFEGLASVDRSKTAQSP